MVTVVLFLVGVVSLLLFDPGQTAFYYKAPITFSWFVKLFSHMVSHGNWKHLLGNFIYGFPYMLYIEHKMQDWKRFLKIFFFCGWIALLGQFLVSKFSMFETNGVIGSSGAIFGLVAFALCIARESKVLKWASLSLLAFHIYSQGYSTWMSIQGYSFGIAFGAHLFGIFAGMYCAWRFIRLPQKSHRRSPSRLRK